MLRAIALGAALVLAGCNAKQEEKQTGGDHKHYGHDHDHGDHSGHGMIALGVKVDGGGEPKAGTPTSLSLTIPGADGKPVRDFAVSHDAKVHLIVIRQGLDHFAHLHPGVDAGSGELTVRHSFPVGGTYHLFADYQPTGGRPGTAVGTIQVDGESPTAPALKPDVPGTVSDGGIKAKVSIDGTSQDRERRIRFELSDSAGKPATNLEPYMGAMGHLNVVSADARLYVHAHPIDRTTGEKNVVTFAAEFPESGLYKGWGQFKLAGTVRVVPLVLQVP